MRFTVDDVPSMVRMRLRGQRTRPGAAGGRAWTASIDHAGPMNEFNGLPAHVLLVHLVVVGVPVAALLTVLSAVWPAANRRLGVITPVVAMLALVCVPITTSAGEWLQARVFHGYTDPNITRHAELGDELLPGPRRPGHRTFAPSRTWVSTVLRDPYGSNSSFPVVRRPARSSWARPASANG